PRHSPQKTPGLSSATPSFSRTDCIRNTWHRRRACGASGLPARNLRLAQARCPRAPQPRWRCYSLLHALALLADQIHRFINHRRSDIESRTKTDRIFAGAEGEKAEIEETFPHFFPRLGVSQTKCEK